MKPYYRILFGTDFSEASGTAWDEALTVARLNGATLYVLHAYEPPNAVQAEAVAPGVYEEWDRNIRLAVTGKLEQLVSQARRMGVQAEPILKAGLPEDVIVTTANDLDADLILLGTHGRKGVSRLFIGSVASRVVATAACPVLTVREPRASLKMAQSA